MLCFFVLINGYVPLLGYSLFRIIDAFPLKLDPYFRNDSLYMPIYVGILARCHVCALIFQSQKKTPAMASRLTDHVWTIEEMIQTVISN